MPLPRSLDVASSFAASVLRLGSGRSASHAGPRPEQPLLVYEFEGCPFCRKVREALTMLDLGADIRPCPKGGPTYRPELVRRGGQSMLPYLVDPNTNDEMYESGPIITHLYRNYGDRPAPAWLRTDLTVPLGSLASLVRAGRGVRYRSATAPELPLELYSFEASPYCRIVREALCELELPYRLINVGKGSHERKAFRSRSGRMMAPWISDPNTGHTSFESAEIVAYLNRTYATSS